MSDALCRIALFTCAVFVVPFGAASAAPTDAEPGEDARGVPPEIVDLVRKDAIPAIMPGTTEFDKKAEHKRATDRRNKLYAGFRDRFAKFDEGWKQFAERKQIVDKAVADADALVKGGKLDDARKALEAVITSVALDDKGKLPREKGRTFVDVRDAELPAIVALARIARDQHDWNAMYGAQANMFARHRIDGDQAATRLLAVAWEDQAHFLGYNASDTSAWSNGQVKAANDAADGGVTLARTFSTGLRTTMINSGAKLKKGDWILMPQLSKPMVKGKQLSYATTINWRVPKACHKTNRIEFVDDAGGFHYEEECTYDEHSQKVTLAATLRDTVPAWAADYWAGMTIVGQIATAGPKWKLVDAVVVDRRFADRDGF